MQKNKKTIGQNLEAFFFNFTMILLKIIGFVLGWTPWIPIAVIYDGILYNNLNLQEALISIVIGICGIFIGLSLINIVKIVEKKKPLKMFPTGKEN